MLAEPHWLWGLLLLPVFALWRGARGTGPAVAFSSLHLLKQIARPGRSTFGVVSASFPYVTVALGLLALARPQRVRTQDNVTANGVEIFLCIDVSLSMSIEDFKDAGGDVNRLTVAKKTCREFIAGRLSDRIGIVAFAGRPYVPSPLTLDHEWLLTTLKDQVRIGLVEDGTAIGSALGAAAKRLDTHSKDVKSKIIVLLTDGSNNSGNIAPLDAAKLAKTLGIKIYTIAVGTDGMHRIPLPDRSGRFLPSMRQEFDLDLMKQIATLTDGKFFRAQDSSSLQQIFETIDSMEKTEIRRQTLVEKDELFGYVLAAALTTGLIGVMLRQTVTREAMA